MRKTDYKVDRIKVFIQNNNPTRTELIKHIVVDINKRVTREYYEKYKRTFRGYYACNIQAMRNSGNIASDKNGKYFVTKQGLKNECSLYNKPYKEQVKDLRQMLRREENYNRTKVKSLRDESQELRMRIKEYEATMYHINVLSS